MPEILSCFRTWLSMGLLAACLGGPAARGAAAAEPEPKLVVLMVVDQWSYAYLDRYRQGLTEEGILARVAASGASYSNCRIDHAFTFTGCGHAVLSTGSPPAVNGIVNNAWYDRGRRAVINCVFDPEARVIGGLGTSEGVSARNLLVPTLGDTLKAWTAGRAKVFAISFKDRSAVLLAGPAADGAFWFDDETGNWVTSDCYRPDLPGYLRNLNESRSSRQYAGQTWELLHEPGKYIFFGPDDSPWERPTSGQARAFPHQLPAAEASSYHAHLIASPFGNDYTLLSAAEIIRHEGLGQDDVPDLLAVSLSSPDYVGHHFGPHSLEVQDLFYRTDLQLGEFARQLDELVGTGRWLLALTSDHGVCPIPEYLQAQGLPAARDPLGDLDALQLRFESLLRERLAADTAADPPLVLEVESNQVVLNAQHPSLQGEHFAAAQRVIRDLLLSFPPVAAARTREELLSGSSLDPLPAMLQRAFHPQRSGDVLFVFRPYHFYPGKYSTSHGTPWSYDTHVPLMLVGCGVPQGDFDRPVNPRLLAPTLAHRLRLEPPAASTTELLYEALRTEPGPVSE